MQLTQKETSLLKDMKDYEKLCVDKYTKYSSSANDPQLKNLFSEAAKIEQSHYDTLSRIESGSAPQQNGSNQLQPTFTAKYTITDNAEKQNDAYLCSDLLETEKGASHLYDTCVFEFTDATLRDALNQIQKDEQHHGKMLYDYMSKNAMYS